MMYEQQHQQKTVVARTRGSGHGGITRLMSPSDFGQILKPFVFLDLFAFSARAVGTMPIHPHSGIATVTILTEGDLRFDDVDSGSGTIEYGGVEWMRAGRGVWHGQEMSAGASDAVRGFQLWVALPPELETAAAESQYIEAQDIPTVHPATIILGQYAGSRSPVRSPEGITYLLVTLKPGDSWEFVPPDGQEVGFIAMSRGSVSIPEVIEEGELAALAAGPQPVTIVAHGEGPAVFVIGSARPHDHELHLGSHSVHTSDAALAIGQRHIADLHGRLIKTGGGRQVSGATPVFR
ncbi:pirin family protein [Sphingobium chlorophenolicum]|nr:pirin family protein [Sphingobium chlorophenolicum]